MKNGKVQNGTSAVNEAILGQIRVLETDDGLVIKHHVTASERLLSEYSKFAVKTAQSTLEMCRVVFEAKKELGSQDFLKFCNAIGRKGEDATVRKYLRIGEKYEKFYQYANLLPNSWTSIYEITQLPSEVFDALVTTENSMANMTGTQIKELMGKSTDNKSKSSVAADSSSMSDAVTSGSNDAAAGTSDVHAEASDDASDENDDMSSSNADRDFAKQATNTMLERVTVGETRNVDVETQGRIAPYEVLIRFNTIPTDDTWWDLVEELENLIQKYNFDVNVFETRPEFV